MKDVALASLQSVPFCPPDRASSRSLSREAGGSLGSIVVTFPDVENYPIVSGHLEHGSLTTALSIVLPRKMEAVPPEWKASMTVTVIVNPSLGVFATVMVEACVFCRSSPCWAEGLGCF